MIDEPDITLILELAPDPKSLRYEGDLKAELRREILNHREQLGLNKLKIIGRDLQGGNPIYAPAVSDEKVEEIIERIVHTRISELVQFNTAVAHFV